MIDKERSSIVRIGMYKQKGMQTKEKLYQIAKDLFYEQGYHKTTMKQISDIAGISSGNLTYYFSTKDKIVEELFHEYLERILTFIEDELLIEGSEENIYQTYLYSGIIFNVNILKDEKTSRFFQEVLLKRSLYELIHTELDPVYQGLIKKYNLRMGSPIHYKYISRADQGARREVLLTFMETNERLPLIDFSMLILRYTSQLIEVPLIEYYRASLPVYNKLTAVDFSGIHLLN